MESCSRTEAKQTDFRLNLALRSPSTTRMPSKLGSHGSVPSLALDRDIVKNISVMAAEEIKFKCQNPNFKSMSNA
jgi:hypothetical protein